MPNRPTWCTFALLSGLIPQAFADGPLRPNPNMPLDRPYTLLNPMPSGIEAERHRVISSGEPWSAILPRPCLSPLDSSAACAERGRFRYRDPEGTGELTVMPVAGYEYRYLGENAHSAGFGGLAAGNSGPLSFRLDARLYSEVHEDARHPGYDHEPFDRQDAEASGAVGYSSFARYRGEVDFDSRWGRVTAGRDATHWGPGHFGNLVFHQDAIPFNQLTYTTHLGPVSVQSLYGQLVIGRDWDTDTSVEMRHLYAHRYEWRPATNLLLGMSEQMIAYKRAAPFAFLPVVPLFITKYTEKERLNNGNLAVDASWRWPGLAMVYSEFLIDDLQSPGSMFGDFWANKWGWLAGAHLIRGLGAAQAGLIAEYARVEPWVYTHYREKTAQTGHFDRPLGNPAGPNSQSLVVKAYGRRDERSYASLASTWSWKGTDTGSDLTDIHDEDDGRTKWFLGPGARFHFAVAPCLAYRFGQAHAYAKAEIGSRVRVVAGVGAGL